MKLAVGEFRRQHASVSSHFSSVPPPSPFSSSSRSDAAFELRRSRLHHINRLFANYCGHSVTFLLLHFLLLQFIGPQHRQISTEKQHPPPPKKKPKTKLYLLWKTADGADQLRRHALAQAEAKANTARRSGVEPQGSWLQAVVTV